VTVKIFGEGLQRVAVREIAPDIFWITHCLGDRAHEMYQSYFALLPNPEAYTADRIVDYPFSAFLFRDERSCLIDTIGPTQRANMLDALAYALDGRPLDYLWISHVELPHAGNTPAIQQRYPGVRLVAAAGGDHYALHGLDGAQLAAPGDLIDLGRHRLETVAPLFVDHGLSQWAYEHHSGLLFTADWGHNLHEPTRGQCFQFLDEMMAGGYDDTLFLDDVKVNAWYQFPWLAWADPDELAVAIDDLFTRYDVRIFAPSHGNLIRKDLARYRPLLREGMRQGAALPFAHVV
jgi:flavorubredoxin